MNGQHLRAFFWLRWRLFLNQMKRGGIANVVILALLGVLAVPTVLGMGAAGFLIGWLSLEDVSAATIMYVWDGLLLFFLFWWAIGLVADLQRSEALSLDKFLHLPVSLTSAFLINYLSSLLSLSLVFFVPAMLGLTLGLAVARGPLMLLLLPLLAAFLLMVTALTYQFQGWLAALMANKRRRQTIIVVLTMCLVLLGQLPNVVNIFYRNQPGDAAQRHLQELVALRQAFKAKQMTEEEFQEKFNTLQNDAAVKTLERAQRSKETLEGAARLGNVLLPPGWLALGAFYLVEGNVVPGLLGAMGLAFIGGASLWRAYRTTKRYYTGHYSKGQKKPATPPAPIKLDHSPAYFLEKRFPWLSEQATAIALASFRSLMRAPEAKMVLLTPLIMVIIFGSMFLMKNEDIAPEVRLLLPIGGMLMVLLGMISLVGNQFGYDRGGFRVYVLSPASRRDILLGKNLAAAPLALGLGAVLALVLELIYPLRLDYLLALPAQFISMFMVLCMLANWLSIMAPMAIRIGSFKAAQPKGLAILFNLLFVFLFPFAMLPTLLPLGIEALLHHQNLMVGMPICLALTLLECVVFALCYRLVLTWQGNMLQSREQRVLELVTVKSE